MLSIPFTTATVDQHQKGTLPDFLGLQIISLDRNDIHAILPIKPHHLAANGYLHAASIVMLADTCCGYGCIVNLPPSAQNFTTIELKSNHLGTALDGTIECHATPVHLGKSTQVWDAKVSDANGKILALFRCTQMLLGPRTPAANKGN